MKYFTEIIDMDDVMKENEAQLQKILVENEAHSQAEKLTWEQILTPHQLTLATARAYAALSGASYSTEYLNSAQRCLSSLRLVRNE